MTANALIHFIGVVSICFGQRNFIPLAIFFLLFEIIFPSKVKFMKLIDFVK